MMKLEWRKRLGPAVAPVNHVAYALKSTISESDYESLPLAPE
jgi:hypothetical protein